MSHENKLFSAMFSTDGNRVVTASEDATARVWNVRPGRALTCSLKHARFAREAQPTPRAGRLGSADWSDGRPAFAQFSPDGRRIVTACGDQTARIWDAVTGQELTPPLRHAGWVTGAEFSPDGQALVTSSAGALVWGARTGGFDNHWAPERPEGASAIIWDARTGRRLVNPLRHGARVNSAQFSPDGLRVVTASWD